MGLKVEPAYIGQTGYLHPVELDRNLLEGLLSRTGVFRYGDFAVTPTGVSGQISIAAGRGFLLGAENAQQGGYFAWSDGADLQPVAAASGNPRIDTLLLRVKDDQYGTISGSPSAYWDIVQGVAAGSPTARVDSDFNSGGGFYVPGAWWRVADIRRNVGDTTIPGGQITSNLRYIRVPGGFTLCTSTTRPSDPVLYDKVHETDTGLSYVWDGTGWDTYPNNRMVSDKRWTGATDLATGITTENVTNMSFTVPIRNGYSYKIKVRMKITLSVAGSTRIRIREDNISGTVRGETHVLMHVAGDSFVEFEGRFDATTNATKTFVITAAQGFASPTLVVARNGSGDPVRMEAYEMGLTSKITSTT